MVLRNYVTVTLLYTYIHDSSTSSVSYDPCSSVDSLVTSTSQ